MARRTSAGAQPAGRDKNGRFAKGNKPKGAGPKPKVLTEEDQIQLEALAAVLTVEQIADYFGMARSTLFKLMAEDSDIRARFDKGKAKAINEIGGKLMEKARKGDTASIIFFLKTQAGWRETNRVEVSGPEGGPVQTLDVTKLSDAALAEMLAVADAQEEENPGD